MPQLSLAASKLQLIQIEKEEVISQLKEANSEIYILQAKNMSLQSIDIKSKGEIRFKCCRCNLDFMHMLIRASPIQDKFSLWCILIIVCINVQCACTLYRFIGSHQDFILGEGGRQMPPFRNIPSPFGVSV